MTINAQNQQTQQLSALQGIRLGTDHILQQLKDGEQVDVTITAIEQHTRKYMNEVNWRLVVHHEAKGSFGVSFFAFLSDFSHILMRKYIQLRQNGKIGVYNVGTT
ncbi:hypothetical protein [Weissella cibaria]|uniref:hypothetical protein n=1 Tax=Weissella cibaria TaxID=137591 RepID=UPI00189BDBD8|nr:hypothetical protein [Weissella cibaria]